VRSAATAVHSERSANASCLGVSFSCVFKFAPESINALIHYHKAWGSPRQVHIAGTYDLMPPGGFSGALRSLPSSLPLTITE
jgi:hypothetical protein